MKRIFAIFAALVLAAVSLSAQTTADYKARYLRTIEKVGVSGVGIETLLDRWAQVDSNGVDYLCARYYYYFDKCKSAEVVAKDTRRYLGMEPLLTLKDSTGANVYYYQEPFYDEETFGQALRYIDKATRLYTERLDIKFLKASALTAYEKDSPDMALSSLMDLIHEHQTAKYVWQYPDVDKVDDEFFCAAIQEYCASFFALGTNSSRDAMKTLSEAMLKKYKDNPDFLGNLGSYYMVNKDAKKALKYYDKVLKVQPSNYAATKNCCTYAIQQKDAKLQKKYLPYLIENGTDAESMSAKARLESLK